ncbi:MAG: hypothetical protein U1E02_42680 [Hydrogenophaga sp.]|jgi:hypothetical protein|uniref:hypothetical protein n=1 Tax=Comamonadaceae TaxID=80864 RepID=UPI00023FC4C7|nr:MULTISPECIES: hypothetical protein [Comamonadaceae]PKO65093.1 MAG: hypothetical protein CVU22_21565 [Betaproteobacteria bacterium HGW-Betaproteobacteria-16]EHL23542.1 hypothetical protein KYG_07081 [Acidovorax sp. NO-1]MDO9203684.1 hypothetical protein [Hydrogenophaga sp.]MDO9481231.1 hypothetical protein [Hydrogenophaga sp.]MDP3345763.1 hypothetical protein [Hydrogenophaga sp.]
MKPHAQWFALIAFALAASAASAQFVKGNEAVRVMTDGTQKVEVPPLPSVALGSPCPAAKPGCAGGGWKMLESNSGLVECTEVFARPTTCRPSTYGVEKRSRTWIVKIKGQWVQCAQPDISGNCVSLKSLPVSAVQ